MPAPVIDPRKYIARTNAPGTCLWCGRKLRPYRWRDDDPTDTRIGDYGDGFVCGMNCGYLFGVAAARNKFRLKPYEGQA